MIFTSDKGKQFKVSKELGKGGEGTAYLVSNGVASAPSVAKIYHKPLSDLQIAKLRRMTAMSDNELLAHGAWPTTLLHKAGEAKPCGFEMPYSKGDELHEIYGPASRKHGWPEATWEHLIFLARNLSCAVDTFHSKNVIIGDVNEKNILFQSDYRIKLVDCDSYQITDGSSVYPCRVGVPLYTPPELQNLNLSQVKRVPAHDLFGLAVMIFQLLFMGRHPYAGINRSSQYLAIENGDAIKAGLYAYGRNANALGISQPPNVLPIDAVTPEIRLLFENAFSKSYIPRPPANEWAFCLEQMRHRLVTCRAEKSHRYSNHLSECPWCSLVNQKGIHFFVCISFTAHIGIKGQDVSAFKNAINQLIKESFTIPALQSFADKYVPQKQPLPPGITGVTFKFFGGIGVILISAVLGFKSPICFWGMVWGIYLIAEGKEKPEYRQEKKIREAKLQQAKQKVDALYKELTALVNNYNLGYAKERNALEDAFKKYVNLPQEKTNQLRLLEVRKREIQLENFLDGFLIAKHKIKGIGVVREKMLISYGVETAADITEKKVMSIPGFSDSLFWQLKQWRLMIESRFVFDARKPIPQNEIEDLNRKLAHLQIDLEERQRKLLKSIVDMGNRTKYQRSNMVTQLEVYSRALKDAQIAFTAFN